MADWKRMTEKIEKGEKLTGEEMATLMSDFCNSFSIDEKGFFEKMHCNIHRTLQQSFTKLCIGWLYYIADSKYYDLRNEASVQAAKKVKEALGEHGNHLPMI